MERPALLTEPRHPAEPGVAGREVGRRHFPHFDGLRAIAAGSILVYHAAYLTGTSQRATIGPYFDRLDIGVPIFFLISGFLLYRPFASGHRADRPPPALGRYLRRRVLRIFPAYWVALTATLLAGLAAARVRNPGDGIAYYGLVQVYSAAHVLGGLPQAWTLCIEITFYLFLPLYAAVLGRATRRRSGASALGAELCGVAVLYAASVAFRLWEWSAAPFGAESFRWLPAHLDYFALGMALAVLSVHLADRPVRATDLRVPGIRPLAWWGLALGCWLLVTRLSIRPDRVGYGVVTAMEQQFLYGLAACFLLVPAVFQPAGREDVVSRLLAWPPIAYLGRVSYGIYLWHYTVLLAWYRFGPARQFTGGLPSVLAAAGILSVALASLSWVLVERPAQALGRGDGRRAPPPRPVRLPATGAAPW